MPTFLLLVNIQVQDLYFDFIFYQKYLTLILLVIFDMKA